MTFSSLLNTHTHMLRIQSLCWHLEDLTEQIPTLKTKVIFSSWLAYMVSLFPLLKPCGEVFLPNKGSDPFLGETKAKFVQMTISVNKSCWIMN